MTRLPLPEPHGQLLIWDHNAKPNDPVRYRYIFTADQMHAYSDACNAALRERVKVLEDALRGALDHMDRARDILTDGKPRPECNWGMLATESARAALEATK